MRRILPSLLAGLLVAALAGWTGLVAAQGSEDGPRPSIVVTTEVLGSLVSELASDVADITVLMDAGADPHTWQPSARDSERLFEADLVVANGLGLEEGLTAVLEQAEAAGIPVFHAADHLAPVSPVDGPSDGPDSPGTAAASSDPASPAGGAHQPTGAHDQSGDHVHADDHDDTGADPHIWLDPLAMREVVLALVPAMADADIDVAAPAARLADELTALDAEVTQTLSVVPPERRRLVSGHGALGRFADRYGFEVVGSVVPGLSSADEPSARDIAELVKAIRTAGVSTVFSDVSTPRSLADAVAAETGIRVVPLGLEQLPASGRYADLIRDVAVVIGEGLSG